jgi:hypothetical protein
MSFGGLCVQAIGFGDGHVKYDREGSQCHHAYAAMVNMMANEHGVLTLVKSLWLYRNKAI